MVSILALFWTFVVVFGLMGFLRGWAKELINTIALIWGITFVTVMERYFPAQIFPQGQSAAAFYTRALVVTVVLFFGFHSPRFRQIQARTKRETVRDMLLGFVLGLFNGFLLMSTLLYYLKQAGYPLPWIIPPEVAAQFNHPDPQVQEQLSKMVQRLPEQVDSLIRWSLPQRLGWPGMIIASIVAGVLIIVLFI